TLPRVPLLFLALERTSFGRRTGPAAVSQKMSASPLFPFDRAGAQLLGAVSRTLSPGYHLQSHASLRSCSFSTEHPRPLFFRASHSAGAVGKRKWRTLVLSNGWFSGAPQWLVLGAP